jgi:hypothetical protein
LDIINLLSTPGENTCHGLSYYSSKESVHQEKEKTICKEKPSVKEIYVHKN